MALRKQEFYEGAALHVLAKTGLVQIVRHVDPFFVVNERHWLLLKYSTRGRSPWGFTMTPDEQKWLASVAQTDRDVRLGLVCGHDGVATIDLGTYSRIAGEGGKALRISCFRSYGEHYEVSGPLGEVGRKIAPSAWGRILDGGGAK